MKLYIWGRVTTFFPKQSEADDFMDNYLQGPKSEVFHKKFNLILRAGGFLYPQRTPQTELI